MAAALAATTLLGVAALATAATLDRRTLAFTLGVRQLEVATKLRPGHEACQLPIDVAAGFSAVRFKVEGVGVPLRVSVRDARSRRLLGLGEISGYRSGSQPVVPVGHAPKDSRVAVCVRNAARHATVGLWGGPARSARTTYATLDGHRLDADIGVEFMRRHEVPALSLLPRMLERMALFRPGFVDPWIYWVLLAALLLGVPALLARALATADRS